MAEAKALALLSELKKSKEADPSVISDILKDLIIPDSTSDSLKVTFLISCLVYHVHTLPNPRSNDTLINTLQLLEALLSESDIGYRINDLKASARVLNCLMLVLDNKELAMTELEKIKSCLQEEFEPVASIESLEKLLGEIPINEESRQVLQQLYSEYINDIFEMVDNVVVRLCRTSEVIIEPPESDYDVVVLDDLSNNGEDNDVVVLTNDQEPVTLTDQQSTLTCDEQSTLYASKRKEQNISVVPSPKKLKLDRKRRVWTESNVKYLVKGVNQFGEGNWTSILMTYGADLPANTNGVALKDKWRNLIKYNHIIKEKGNWIVR